MHDNADEAFQPDEDVQSIEPPLVQAEKPKRSLKFYVVIAAVFVCACLTIGGAVVAIGLNRVSSERAPVESVLVDFMEAMATKDSEAAYAVYSPRAQRQFSQDVIEDMMVGNNFVLFEGYQSLMLTNIKILAVTNTNPNVAQGTVAEVTGIISYEGDFTGQFDATLEKDDEQWLLHNINVTVPPNKLGQ